MKRVLIIVVALLLIIAAVVAWWLMRPQPSVATILPADTMLLARIPNGWATKDRYDKSKLKQVLGSREMAALGAMIIAKAAENGGEDFEELRLHFEELTALFIRNLSGECFLAVLELDAVNLENNGLIAGLRPFQGHGDMELFLNRAKELAAEHLADQPRGTGAHDGVSYEWIELHSGLRLCQANVGGWSITAIGEKALQRFIDRAKGRDQGPALADSALFKAAQGQIGEKNDAEFFLNFEPIKTKVLSQMEADPTMAAQVPMMREAYAPLQAFAAGMRFKDNGDVEDVWASLMPPNQRPNLGATFQPCAFKTLPGTGLDTLAYFAQNMDWLKYWQYLTKLYGSSPELSHTLDLIKSGVASYGLDLEKNILGALGPEIAVQLDWPKADTFPDLSLHLQVANEADLEPVIKLVTDNLAEQTTDDRGAKVQLGKWMTTDLPDGVQARTFRLTQPGKLSPTYAVANGFLSIFLTQEGALRVLAGNEKESLTDQPAYRALGLSLDGASSLFYVNMEALVVRTYATVRPMVELAAAFVPELAQELDDVQLPQELEFARGLGAWGMTASVNDVAGIAHSVSSIGNPIFPLALVAGASAPAVSEALSGMTSQAAPTPPPADPESAEGVRAELRELRAAIAAWTASESPAPGTPVEWAVISTYLIPGSRLEQSQGKDILGNAYILGVAGQTQADVSPETKNHFSSKDDAFWAPDEAEALPVP